MHAPLSHYLTPGTAQLQPQDGQYKRIHLKRIQRDTICINKSTAPGLQVNYTFKKREHRNQKQLLQIHYRRYLENRLIWTYRSSRPNHYRREYKVQVVSPPKL